MANIAEAQLKIGDIEGAQKTVRMIKVSRYKDIIDAEIAEAQKKPLDIKNEQKTLAATQEPTDIKLSDWIKKLDDDVEKDDCPLKTEIFLDLDSYLKSLLRSDDSGEVYGRLKNSAEKIVKARNIIMQSLKAQIGN